MSVLRAKRAVLGTTGLFLAILAGAALLRFYAIGRKSLWLDEAVTVNLMDGRYTDMLTRVIGHDAHPPLYYALMHLWMQRSGSVERARAFSAVASVATVAVFYPLARVLLPPVGALLATLVLATSAFQVYFAQEARNYALAAFFVTLSWYFLAQLVAGRRLEHWRWWLGLALANAAAVYTFYYAVFAVVAQLLVLLVLWRPIGRRLVVPWLAWQLLPAVLFALYVPVILDRLAELSGLSPPGGGLTVISAAGASLTASQFAFGFVGELAGDHGALAQAAGAAVGLLAVAAGALGVRRCREAGVVGLAWLLGPVVLLALLPIRGHVYEPKHLIAAAPALALLPAVGFAAARRAGRVVSGALVAVIVAGNVVSLAAYYGPGVEKENWRDAVAEVVRHVEPGDMVVFSPFYVSHPFLYYYRPYIRKFPIMTVDAPATGEAFRGGELKLGRRVWLVEGRSNVEKPNPRVAAALAEYPTIVPTRRFEGVVGTVSVTLYDTFRPPPRGDEGRPGRPEAAESPGRPKPAAAKPD